MDYYQIMGVSRNCTRDQLHRAFRELSKKYHPDRFPEERRPEAEKRYQQIVIAFNHLKNPENRKRYESKPSRSPAPTAAKPDVDPATETKKFYKIGHVKSQQGDYPAAVEAFKRAIHFREDPEFFYQKGLAEARVKKLQKDAVASMQKAIALNPKNPKYYHSLASMFFEFGLPTRAKTVLEKAMQLFPANQEIQDLARTHFPEKFKKTSLFGGLFGKRKGD